MRLPALFQKDRSVQAVKDAQDRTDKILVETFRLLGQVCGKMADLIEAQRLSRNGFEKQERYLERIDGGAANDKPQR